MTYTYLKHLAQVHSLNGELVHLKDKENITHCDTFQTLTVCDITPLLTYLSSLKFVLVVLRFGEFALSSVSQVSVDGEKDVGICSCFVHITCPHRHLVCVDCDGRKKSIMNYTKL